MAGNLSETRIVAGLLDRLLDDEPEVSTEPPWREGQVIRELKKSLRRDLEELLNARRSLDTLPDGLEELPSSLLNYGLPDLQSVEVREQHDIQRMCSLIAETIRRFEPRLQQVSVSPVVETSRERALDRRFRFSIEAVLVAEPLREDVRFRSAVETGSGAILVETAA